MFQNHGYAFFRGMSIKQVNFIEMHATVLWIRYYHHKIYSNTLEHSQFETAEVAGKDCMHGLHARTARKDCMHGLPVRTARTDFILPVFLERPITQCVLAINRTYIFSFTRQILWEKQTDDEEETAP
jgi:hypothetical protein